MHKCCAKLFKKDAEGMKKGGCVHLPEFAQLDVNSNISLIFLFIIHVNILARKKYCLFENKGNNHTILHM